jgi:D-lactate dehydrogenase
MDPSRFGYPWPRGRAFDLYRCANRTCEVAMEHATQAPYESFIYALEELTR